MHACAQRRGRRRRGRRRERRRGSRRGQRRDTDRNLAKVRADPAFASAGGVVESFGDRAKVEGAVDVRTDEPAVAERRELIEGHSAILLKVGAGHVVELTPCAQGVSTRQRARPTHARGARAQRGQVARGAWAQRGQVARGARAQRGQVARGAWAQRGQVGRGFE